jgi:hypothetical protein
MTVSSVNSTPAIQAQTPATTSRATDGDYLARSAHTSQTKDSDGDYKPISTTNSAAATSSSSVLASLSTLTKGGNS